MAKRFDQLSPAGKALALDLFCRSFDFDGVTAPSPALPGETRVQFVQRMAQEWIMERAAAQRQYDVAAAANTNDLV